MSGQSSVRGVLASMLVLVEQLSGDGLGVQLVSAQWCHATAFRIS